MYGCLTPLNAVYDFISPQTAPDEYTETNNPLGTFCFNHDSMATLLDQHDPPLSWKYYTPAATSIWDAVSWFQDLCEPNATYTKCTSAEWKNNVDVHPADVLTDIGNCDLRNVVWVIPSVQNSDHMIEAGDRLNRRALLGLFHRQRDWPEPMHGHGKWPGARPIGRTLRSSSPGTTGEAGTITNRQLFCLSQDKGQGDYQYGFRVPLVVVSAYTPMGYIDNSRSDFGSILRFVEQNFGIPEGALNFADQRATTDLTEFFDLTQTPRMFNAISAPLDANFFLHDPHPDEPPDED